jgi:hypothetical protein
VPAVTFVVESVATIGVPSEVEVAFVEMEYVGLADLDVSLICADADAPPAVTVKVSAPSVKLSLARSTVMVACPLLATVVVPLKVPLATSAALTPESVYGTEVPEATPVVDKVNVTAEPSLTAELPGVRVYVATDWDVSRISIDIGEDSNWSPFEN